MDTNLQSLDTPGHDGDVEEEMKRQTEDLKSDAEQAKLDAKEKATRAYEDVKEGTRKAARDSVTYAKDVVSSQKSTLVSKLDEYKDAILAASEKLESEDDGIAAEKIRKAATGIGNVTQYLRETDPSELYDEAGRLARKHPEIIFGGMFLAGLGIARFLKSSSDQKRNVRSTALYRPEYYSSNTLPPVS